MVCGWETSFLELCFALVALKLSWMKTLLCLFAALNVTSSTLIAVYVPNHFIWIIDWFLFIYYML